MKVISPLVWLLVNNEILRDLEKQELKAVANAEVAVLLSWDLFTPTIRIRQQALDMLETWSGKCGLVVNLN